MSLDPPSQPRLPTLLTHPRWSSAALVSPTTCVSPSQQNSTSIAQEQEMHSFRPPSKDQKESKNKFTFKTTVTEHMLPDTQPQKREHTKYLLTTIMKQLQRAHSKFACNPNMMLPRLNVTDLDLQTLASQLPSLFNSLLMPKKQEKASLPYKSQILKDDHRRPPSPTTVIVPTQYHTYQRWWVVTQFPLNTEVMKSLTPHSV